MFTPFVFQFWEKKFSSPELKVLIPCDSSYYKEEAIFTYAATRIRSVCCDQRLIGAFNQIGKENQTTQHQDKHIM